MTEQKAEIEAGADAQASELLPCPFCGGKNLYLDPGCVMCLDCHISGPDRTRHRKNYRGEKPGFDAWNSRPIESQLAANACVMKDGVIGDEYGNARCPLDFTAPLTTALTGEEWSNE